MAPLSVTNGLHVRIAVARIVGVGRTTRRRRPRAITSCGLYSCGLYSHGHYSYGLYRYATLCSIVGVSADDASAKAAGLPAVDSQDQWPVLAGDSPSVRDEIHISQWTLISGDYKLLTGYGLYSSGLHSYGLYSSGLRGYGLYSGCIHSYGPKSYGLCSYFLYSYGLYSCCIHSYGPKAMTCIVMARAGMAVYRYGLHSPGLQKNGITTK